MLGSDLTGFEQCTVEFDLKRVLAPSFECLGHADAMTQEHVLTLQYNIPVKLDSGKGVQALEYEVNGGSFGRRWSLESVAIDP